MHAINMDDLSVEAPWLAVRGLTVDKNMGTACMSGSVTELMMSNTYI